MKLSGSLYALIEGDFKLIHYPDQTKVLYYLCSDPLETTDISENHPDIVDSLSEKLDAWLAGTPAYDRINHDRKLSPETIKQLKALGYID